MREIIGKINSLCKKYKSELTKDEISCLTNFDYKEANFYGLPKIHKSELIRDAVRSQKSEVITIPSPQDLKIRPIIGGPASPTSNLSKLLDKLLKPFMVTLPSFVKDSIDLLKKADDWEYADEEYTLITMDISNMYMNISDELGEKAIRFFIQKYPHLLHPRFSLEFVVEAVLLVLRNNISFFDGNYRRQIHGCAMGSHKSPPYASLAIGYIEHKADEIFRETKSVEYADYVKKMLERFLDDVFLKWRMSLGDPKDFFDVLNNIEDKINFTMESGKRIPFLDVLFILGDDGRLSTDIYYKPTDTHNYVQFGSFHPHKTLTNIPFTLARRVCIIVSDDDVRDFRYSELKEWLLRKKYPVEVINSGIERARRLDRKAILCSTEGDDEQNAEQTSTIPFVFTNNCSNPEVLNTVRRGLDILTPSVRMQTVMKDKSVVAARRQPRNLKSILFKPRFDTRTDQGKGSVLPCKKDPNRKKTRGRPCKCCDLLEECTHIKFKGSNEPFEIRFHFTCDTRNVIYAITCQGCGDNNIGKNQT